MYVGMCVFIHVCVYECMYVYMYIGSLWMDGSGEMDADADTGGGSWPSADSQRRTTPGYAHAPGMYIYVYTYIHTYIATYLMFPL